MPAAISPPAEAGFLYILSEPKPEYVQEYHDWYNTEHGPARVQLDFVTNGYRYKCVDADSRTFLAIYDLARLGGLQEPAYNLLRDCRSARERRVLEEQINWMNRRVYKNISSRGLPEGPSPVMMTVSLLVRNELVAEVNRWYEKEHTYDLSLIPGWRRTRRFELIEADDLQLGYTEMLAVHEFDSINGIDGPEHVVAKSKPWRNKMMAQVDHRINRRFKYFHEFRASDYRQP